MSKLTAREIGNINRSSLQAYFTEHPDWISAVALAKATGQHVNTVHAHCRNLIRFGYLEEKLIWVDYPGNNSGRHIIHYRLAPAIKSCHRR
jgi:predicted ArsR family transcriptional regulator